MCLPAPSTHTDTLTRTHTHTRHHTHTHPRPHTHTQIHTHLPRLGCAGHFPHPSHPCQAAATGPCPLSSHLQRGRHGAGGRPVTAHPAVPGGLLPRGQRIGEAPGAPVRPGTSCRCIAAFVLLSEGEAEQCKGTPTVNSFVHALASTVLCVAVWVLVAPPPLPYFDVWRVPARVLNG